jgi:hypothetical protein
MLSSGILDKSGQLMVSKTENGEYNKATHLLIEVWEAAVKKEGRVRSIQAQLKE